MRAQEKMWSLLFDMKSAWRNFQELEFIGRLPYWDRIELRLMGLQMVELGQAYIEEADRQEAEYRREVG